MRQDGDSEVDTLGKRQRTTPVTNTFDMISSVLEEQQARRRNKVELAIQLLQTEYQDRLSTSAFIDAVDVLTNEAKASVFITLNSTNIRDLWLCKNANIELGNEDSI
jgi:hypothetical protein